MAPTNIGQPVTLKAIRAADVAEVKRLHSILFPLAYRDSYFSDLLQSNSLSFMILLDDVCIGCICATLSNDSHLYIKTIGILAYYRGRGLGTVAFDCFLKAVTSNYPVIRIELHVQYGNQRALNFYIKHGFSIANRIENYYRRMEPSAALLLFRLL